MQPYGKIRGPAEIGRIIRGHRKHKRLNQTQAAGISGVGVRFLSELERGKPTQEIALVLRVLDRLGLQVWIVPRGSRLQWNNDE